MLVLAVKPPLVNFKPVTETGAEPAVKLTRNTGLLAVPSAMTAAAGLLEAKDTLRPPPTGGGVVPPVVAVGESWPGVLAAITPVCTMALSAALAGTTLEKL